MKIFSRFISNIFSIKLVKPKTRIYFCDQVKKDSFHKVAENLTLSQNYARFYKSLQNRMGIIKPVDIISMSERISKQFSMPKEDVYSVLGLLTQFSSNRCFNKISKSLFDRDIANITNLYSFKELTSIYKKVPVNLTSVMDYISLKNFRMNSYYDEGYRAWFLDSNLLDYLDSFSKNDKNYFIKNIVGSPKEKFVYLENFENGYNLFNQFESLEQFTINILDKASDLSKQNSGSIVENVKMILNKPTLDRAYKAGMIPEIISYNSKTVPTPKEICDNVNPIFPSLAEIEDEIHLTACSIAKDINKDLETTEKFLINYLNQVMQPITSRRFSETLKIVKNNIDEYLIKNNRDLDNVYFVLPYNNKSYTVATYQYQKLSDSPLKLIFSKFGKLDNLGLFKKLPKNSTLVVLDDCSISGLSLTQDAFNYKRVVANRKDLSVLFCPIYSTKIAKENVESYIKKARRSNKDVLIHSGVIPKWVNSNHFEDAAYLDKDETVDYFTATVFPYMGPDSNCSPLEQLFAMFLAQNKAQKAYKGDMLVF